MGTKNNSIWRFLSSKDNSFLPKFKKRTRKIQRKKSTLNTRTDDMGENCCVYQVFQTPKNYTNSRALLGHQPVANILWGFAMCHVQPGT